MPPGNHDYDAWWTAPVAGTVPDDASAAALAAVPPENRQTHIGGLENFKRAFGSDSEFFRGKSWYVGAFEGGTSSAQIFAAGGYRFLHFAFEMHAGDQVLAWAERVMNEHSGLPTVVSTHDYLSARGERVPFGTMDLARADPGYNNDAETIWRKFISTNDQIFMVLSGHQPGQALRIDRNESGHAVYQILADFQDRGQASRDAGQTANTNLGDGWYREMTFASLRQLAASGDQDVLHSLSCVLERAADVCAVVQAARTARHDRRRVLARRRVHARARRFSRTLRGGRHITMSTEKPMQTLRAALIVGLLAMTAVVAAQDPSAFNARLDWVPISGAERNDVSGSGFVAATLSRSRLSIMGCFEGLPAAATRASLHQGVATGARGPAIAELEITEDAAGTVAGNVDLSREQRDALLAGHLYIQLHAARGVAPDNAVLWGWLLTSQATSTVLRRC